MAQDPGEHPVAERLEPARCYSVLELQDILGIPAQRFLDAVQSGEIDRHLSEQPFTTLMGADVQSWLAGRLAWSVKRIRQLPVREKPVHSLRLQDG